MQKGDGLFKSVNKLRYLGVEELHKFLLENSLIDVNFFEKRTVEVTAGAYLVSVTEIISSCQQVDSGALSSLLITMFCGYYGKTSASLCLIRTLTMKMTIYHLQVKFESLPSLENYIISVYYVNYPMSLYHDDPEPQKEYERSKYKKNRELKKERKKN